LEQTSIININIEDEMRQSYLDYAMSVIIGRALPEVKDGLKARSQKNLFAMNEIGNDFNKPYKKIRKNRRRRYR
jgi:DNA gyrase subunit A (EC 5.99.1.3)